MFNSIFDSTLTLTLGSILACMGVSLVLGVAIAAIYQVGVQASKSFLLTLALLPALVAAVILMVNGNLGAGVAVAGTFSLVRFRSVAGSAREICAVFFSMAVGLATGMGQLGFAAVVTVLVGAAMLIFTLLPVGEDGSITQKSLKITLPENLDFEGMFDDIFAKYTAKAKLVTVKTVNMGSLYELHYLITLKKDVSEKAMIDELRCRNGNLNISCGRVSMLQENL